MRVTVESSALSEGRFYKLANGFFEGSRHEAIGTLVLFWFDTQEREFVSGTKKEILHFLPYISDEENGKLFDALLSCGYLKKKSKSVYEISGNDKHVENLQALREGRIASAKKAAKARWSKEKHEKSDDENASRITPPHPSDAINAVSDAATTLHYTTPQCSSSHFNSIQSNSDKKDAEVASTSAKPKILPEFLDESIFWLLAKTSIDLQRSWLATYQDPEWLKMELKKASNWIHANPKKAPKSDFARFLNNWLSRGWEQHRKTIVIKEKSPAEVWLEQKTKQKEVTA